MIGYASYGSLEVVSVIAKLFDSFFMQSNPTPLQFFAEPFLFHLSKAGQGNPHWLLFTHSKRIEHFFRLLWLCVTLHCTGNQAKSLFYLVWLELALYGLISISLCMQIIIIQYLQPPINSNSINIGTRTATPLPPPSWWHFGYYSIFVQPLKNFMSFSNIHIIFDKLNTLLNTRQLPFGEK